MNKYPIFQIDAFAEKPFSGNPAAVVILDEWPDNKVMQNIAFENNLSETAFLIIEKDNVLVRYFTPTVEVDLCGHATLASAFVLFAFYHFEGEIVFSTPKRGDLYVTQKDGIVNLNFPADDIRKEPMPASVVLALKAKPIDIYRGITDLLLVFENESNIREMEPDFGLLEQLPFPGVIVTAPGDNADFVSRFFAPAQGIPEDPVTGSAHTTLIPYWSNRFGKTKMVAKQLSKRGGTLYCQMAGKRVNIGGRAIHYLSGEIHF
ncbi:MAG: PhzF family phenazine biosynthesis protein [Prolixibacteraceae bacterium]|nr:PhzF family phenazine biosynthesis protein [Prolixibacteraceae bacterium]